jgi:hypothetical protein
MIVSDIVHFARTQWALSALLGELFIAPRSVRTADLER